MVRRLCCRAGRAQLLLDAFAIGDVSNSTGDEEALLRGQRTQTDFDRKFIPILPETKELEAGSHRADPGTDEILIAVADMTFSIALRQQDLNRFTQELLTRITESAFRLR